MTLTDAINKWATRGSKSILAGLSKAGISDVQDINSERLWVYHDFINETYAPNTAKLYMAELKAVLGKISVRLDFDYKKPLNSRGGRCLKTFLTKEELRRLENVGTNTEIEQGVKYLFLMSAYTGCRISDVQELTGENISDGHLTYVSKKTSIKATVPCHQRLGDWLGWLKTSGFKMPSGVCYNYTIQGLCRRAGIVGMVTIYKAGKTIKQAKWKCITSHSGRISFASNLAMMKVPLHDIMKLMGHSSPEMTCRYIATENIELTNKQMEFFN